MPHNAKPPHKSTLFQSNASRQQNPILLFRSKIPVKTCIYSIVSQFLQSTRLNDSLFPWREHSLHPSFHWFFSSFLLSHWKHWSVPVLSSWGGQKTFPLTLGMSVRLQIQSPVAGSPSWRTWTQGSTKGIKKNLWVYLIAARFFATVLYV